MHARFSAGPKRGGGVRVAPERGAVSLVPK
jgi:hypothetical protein